MLLIGSNSRRVAIIAALATSCSAAAGNESGLHDDAAVGNVAGAAITAGSGGVSLTAGSAGMSSSATGGGGAAVNASGGGGGASAGGGGAGASGGTVAHDA